MMKSLTLQLRSLNQELHRSPMNKMCISCDDSFIVGMPRDIETEYFYLSDSVYKLIQELFFCHHKNQHCAYVCRMYKHVHVIKLCLSVACFFLKRCEM